MDLIQKQKQWYFALMGGLALGAMLGAFSAPRAASPGSTSPGWCHHLPLPALDRAIARRAAEVSGHTPAVPEGVAGQVTALAANIGR